MGDFCDYPEYRNRHDPRYYFTNSTFAHKYKILVTPIEVQPFHLFEGMTLLDRYLLHKDVWNPNLIFQPHVYSITRYMQKNHLEYGRNWPT